MTEQEDTSGFIMEQGKPIQIDFDNLSSERFSNVKEIYRSPNGATVLFSAIRYGKRFILKGINADFHNDPLSNISLAKEFEIGIGLDHPNIRQTIGFEDVPNLGKVIILEYIDGISLNDFINSRKLPPKQARTIAKQIASALSYLHSKQIIHKDLKLSNILISYQGENVKLIDFNLADSDRFVVLKNPGGTTKYMAPEQRNADAKPSIANDIYSFGVILKELAQCTSDPELMAAGEKCTLENPELRPHSVDSIPLPDAKLPPSTPFSRFLSSKILTFVITIICVLLSLYICYLVTYKHLI